MSNKYLNEYKPIEERLGQIGVNKLGEKMEIIKCYPDYRGDVRFLDGKDCIINIKYINFRYGIAKNYNRVEYGYNGYVGQGPYATGYRDEYGRTVMAPEFNVWVAMHRRAGNYNGEKPSYCDVEICEEWNNYQNFAEWYNNNVYECGERLCLDKDILYPMNRIYSPETCRLVPDSINQLFKHLSEKDNGLPVGVCIDKKCKSKPYTTSKLKRINSEGNIETFRFKSDSIEEVYDAYKKAKENYIRDVADFYIDIIPIEIYEAMKNYSYDLYN